MVPLNEKGEPASFPAPLRACFQKRGALQFISHLDLMRTMTRVMTRAQIPVKYTSGFHPKPHLVFSAPLSVGAESRREFVDVEVLEPVNLEDVKNRLNAGLPDELRVERVYYPENKFNEITGAEYEIILYTNTPREETAKACQDLLLSSPLFLEKRTKSGDKEVDVSPSVKGATFSCQKGGYRLLLTLYSECGSFLNPDYLINLLYDRLLMGEAREYTVTRTRLTDKNGNDFH